MPRRGDCAWRRRDRGLRRQPVIPRALYRAVAEIQQASAQYCNRTPRYCTNARSYLKKNTIHGAIGVRVIKHFQKCGPNHFIKYLFGAGPALFLLRAVARLSILPLSFVVRLPSRFTGNV